MSFLLIRGLFWPSLCETTESKDRQRGDRNKKRHLSHFNPPRVKAAGSGLTTAGLRNKEDSKHLGAEPAICFKSASQLSSRF
jgi:hypothetical protein